MNIFKGFAGLIFSLILLASNHANAATLSPSKVNLLKGESVDISVTNISAPIALIKSSDLSVFNSSSLIGGNKITITAANKLGTAKLEVKDKRGSKYVTVKVIEPMSASVSALSMSVNQTVKVTLENVSGSLSVTASNTKVISVSKSGNTLTIKAKLNGYSVVTVNDSKTTISIPVTVGSSQVSNLNGALLASNCYQCHGTYGSGGFDKISGDSGLYKELQEFLDPNGEDADGIMAAHLKGYTTEQLQAISSYLSTIKP